MSTTTQEPVTVLCHGDEPGFELDTSPGVMVQPLLATSGADNVDLFFLTLRPGAEVTPESHPYAETLIVVEGELSCRAGAGEPVPVRAGEIWHTAAGTWHHVRNNGGCGARAVMHLGF